MRNVFSSFVLASLAGIAGCSTPPVTAADDMTVAATQDLSKPAAALPDMVTAGPPGVPVLVDVSLVVHGTFMLSWQNPASGCSTLTVNRKKDAGAYAVAKMVTGTATQLMDQPGHTAGTYCYTVVCSLGGADSAPSNEKCATQ